MLELIGTDLKIFRYLQQSRVLDLAAVATNKLRHGTKRTQLNGERERERRKNERRKKMKMWIKMENK